MSVSMFCVLFCAGEAVHLMGMFLLLLRLLLLLLLLQGHYRRRSGGLLTEDAEVLLPSALVCSFASQPCPLRLFSSPSVLLPLSSSLSVLLSVSSPLCLLLSACSPPWPLTCLLTAAALVQQPVGSKHRSAGFYAVHHITTVKLTQKYTTIKLF